jgi:hypothetical protein
MATDALVAVLAARKLTNCNGEPLPLTEAAFANSISAAEKIKSTQLMRSGPFS